MSFDPFRAMGPMGLPMKWGFELGRKLVSPSEKKPSQTPPPQRQSTPQTPARHPANARTAQFQDVPPMNATAQQLYNAILKYPETKANQAEARQIAVEVEAASRAFGIDPKVMLSIIAHESGGFDPKAESHSGAKGLGQLTGVAIQEMRRLSFDPTYATSYPKSKSERQHYSDPEIRALVERPQVQAIFQRLAKSDEHRYNIRDNIWGSAFYARIAMDRGDDAANGAVKVLGEDAMMGVYNGAEPSERRAHSAGIATAYRQMFAQAIPSTLRPTV